ELRAAKPSGPLPNDVQGALETEIKASQHLGTIVRVFADQAHDCDDVNALEGRSPLEVVSRSPVVLPLRVVFRSPREGIDQMIPGRLGGADSVLVIVSSVVDVLQPFMRLLVVLVANPIAQPLLERLTKVLKEAPEPPRDGFPFRASSWS